MKDYNNNNFYHLMFGETCDVEKPIINDRNEFLRELASYDEAISFFIDELNEAIFNEDAEQISQLKRDVQRSKTEKVRFLKANKQYIKEYNIA